MRNNAGWMNETRWVFAFGRMWENRRPGQWGWDKRLQTIVGKFRVVI